MNCSNSACFSFVASCSKFGHYINSIGGHSENNETKNYWLVYTLTQPPDVADPPSSEELSPAGLYILLCMQGKDLTLLLLGSLSLALQSDFDLGSLYYRDFLNPY
jgi:hypothetical protein